jgi:hypothetical protein
MNRYIKALATLCMASALVACGGGGGSSGATTDGTGTGTGGGTVTPGVTTPAQQTAKVADFAVFTDKTAITNNGTDVAVVTVQAVDSNRTVVAGALVTVSTDQNSVFTPSTTSGVTDDQGKFTGTVGIGADKTDRDITISVTINGITKRTVVRVSGTKLTLSALPASAQPGGSVTLTARLRDAAGNAIIGVPVSFGGTVPSLQNATATTSSSGDATLTFTAPTAAGAYTITARGAGTLATDLNLTVFASSSSVPVANIPAGVKPSLSASPNVLSVNAPGTTANKAVLRFLILDSFDTPVPNVRVRFEDLTTGLPAQGADIATKTTMYTDASGSVTTQYIAGQNSSRTNGVLLRACYSATEFLSATDCPNQVTTTLTVAGQALAVSIGDDNLLEKGQGTYIKRFAVTVADAAGRAVANAPVDISVDLTHYSKGDVVDPFLGTTDITGLAVVPLVQTDAYAVDPTTGSVMSGTTAKFVDASASGQRIWCPNEDVNRNANLDPGEDINNTGALEPRKSDLIISYDNPSVTTTNSGGVLVIKVEYSQRFALWLAYKIRVTANVAGSEGMAERLFVTNALQADAANGSFLTPPYGVHSCVTPN